MHLFKTETHDVIINNLTKTFGEVVAVDKVSFTIEAGKFFTLLGPSGCGKSTTLRCIAGLEDPDKGQIIFGEKSLYDSEKSIKTKPEDRNIGMVFQSYAVWPHMTVFNNVAYPLRIKKYSHNEINEMVEAALSFVELADYGTRYPSQLSGGQQQRVALARAIVGKTNVLLFDEPLSNLDAVLREKMRFDIARWQKELGITTIYVTHDQSEAMVMSDILAVMDNGKLMQLGSPDEIYRKPNSKMVASFLGTANFINGKVVSLKNNGYEVITDNNEKYVIKRSDQNENLINQDVTILIRPEDIQIIDPDNVTNKTNVFKGSISKVAFLGNQIDYECEFKTFPLRFCTNNETRHSIGTNIYVYLPPEKSVIIKD